jgi:hypothetical protein
VLSTINQGTCRVAASLVRRLERGVARAAHADEHKAAARLVPSCEDADADSDGADTASDPAKLGPNIL